MAINALSIPTGVGPTSYSGLGQGYQSFNNNSVIPLLQSLLSGYQGNVNSAYGNATSGLGTFAKQTITPAIQSVINTMAGKNMLNSSVAGDAISGPPSYLQYPRAYYTGSTWPCMDCFLAPPHMWPWVELIYLSGYSGQGWI